MGSGKDTCVDYLVSKYPDYTRISFAGALYDILEYAQEKCGFEKKKDRKFLQFVGTDWGRTIDNNVWINIVLNKEISGIGLISDIRFKNELDALKENGWVCVKVIRNDIDKNRCGTGSSSHESEVDIENKYWDYIIDNNSSFEELNCQIDKIIKNIN